MDSIVFVVVVLGLTHCSFAREFYVGGRDGWVLNPSESYDHWAGRNRFQVNDTLVFNYKNGTDSVLVMNKDHFNSCNTSNPIEVLGYGRNSVFKFHRSGPFFFISGVAGNCQKGQKLHIVVLALRHKNNNNNHSSTALPPSLSPSLSPSPSPFPFNESSHAPSPSNSSSKSAAGSSSLLSVSEACFRVFCSATVIISLSLLR